MAWCGWGCVQGTGGGSGNWDRAKVGAEQRAKPADVCKPVPGCAPTSGSAVQIGVPHTRPQGPPCTGAGCSSGKKLKVRGFAPEFLRTGFGVPLVSLQLGRGFLTSAHAVASGKLPWVIYVGQAPPLALQLPQPLSLPASPIPAPLTAL